MGKIHLLTGNGAGKTASALGVALRAAGHGKKVVVVQFMKGQLTGEVKALRKLGVDVRQFGRKEFVDLKNPSAQDVKKANEALAYIGVAYKKKPFLIILDEANLAAAIGLIDEGRLIELLKQKPKNTTIYLTGRHAPASLLKLADFATEVLPLKYPKEIYTRQGISY